MIVGGAGAFVLILILLFTGILPGLKKQELQKYELSVWGLKRDEQAMKEVVARYVQLNKNVTIKYAGIADADYEETLVDNLAAGSGPDIFFLKNDWFQKHKNKIAPADVKTIAPATMQELFPEVVSYDFIYQNQVYGLPLSVDTLALVYNRSIFDVKQIAVPPVTWDGVRAVVPSLRELTAGKITKAAIAIGTTDETILNARDILTAAMMQVGGFTYDKVSNRVSFANLSSQKGLGLYTDFADPKSPNYAWDPALGGSVDAFANGRVAMVFLYSSQLAAVRAKNPVLNYATLPMPQISQDRPVNIASYWALTVSNRTKNSAPAWDFIKFAATDASAAASYANSSGLPPALRSLIAGYGQSGSLKAFVSQTLTAKSWPVPDPEKVSGIFNNMIKSSLADRSEPAADKALRAAEEAVNQLIRR